VTRRTQQGPGLKLALGSYEVIKALRNDCYILHKVGEHEGPYQTSSTADFMKPWIDEDSDGESLDEGDDINGHPGRMSDQDGRV